jgi:hypothetical protein
MNIDILLGISFDEITRVLKSQGYGIQKERVFTHSEDYDDYVTQDVWMVYYLSPKQNKCLTKDSDYDFLYGEDRVRKFFRIELKHKLLKMMTEDV